MRAFLEREEGKQSDGNGKRWTDVVVRGFLPGRGDWQSAVLESWSHPFSLRFVSEVPVEVKSQHRPDWLGRPLSRE